MRTVTLLCLEQLLYMVQNPGHYENWSGSIWRTLKCGAAGELKR